MKQNGIFAAIEFAAKAHAGQYRRASRLPYIYHPLNVARILIESDAPEEVAMAGVLHDTVEDTQVTIEDVRTEFGDAVARLVEGMSEPHRKDTWEQRKRDMLALFETAPQDLLWIELADKLDNIREIRRDLTRNGDATWKRFNRGRDQQKWLYEQFADLFLRRVESAQGMALAREFQEDVRAVFGETRAG